MPADVQALLLALLPLVAVLVGVGVGALFSPAGGFD